MNKLSILLLATERSGTNLLRAIMSAHSQISSPPPFSMIDLMFGASYKYLGEGENDHFDVMVDDAITLTQTHMNPWDIECKPEDIKEKAKNQSFWELFKVLNDHYAASEKKAHWFSKEPGLFKGIYQLAMHLPNGKFIHMVRDPRDVVASMLEGGLHEHNVYIAARRWRDEQIACLNAYSDPQISNRMFKVSYEGLLNDSESTVRRLMDFLDISYESSQLEFYKNKKVIEHSTKSQFWKNLNKPIDQKNKGNYLSKLNKRQISIIETLCWDEMHALGYTTTIAAPKHIPVYVRLCYIGHNYLKRSIKSLRISLEDGPRRERKQNNKAIRNRSFSR